MQPKLALEKATIRMAQKRPKRQPTKLTIDVIETRVLSLVDEFGNQRANLFCSSGEQGMTIIQLNDDSGRPRLELQVDWEGNPSIRLMQANGQLGISMAANRGNGNGISICDAEGAPSVRLGISDPNNTRDPRAPHSELTVVDPFRKRGWSPFDGVYELPNRKNLLKLND